ncbi:SDR family NAD(P)-dependent oxidoreductase, partial [Serratia sp. IR-2025]
MDLYLQDKVVLVTGGGAGIGAAIAHVLAEEGAIPVLVTNAAPEAALLADLQRLQPRTEVILTELCDEAACRRAVSQTLAGGGRRGRGGVKPRGPPRGGGGGGGGPLRGG